MNSENFEKHVLFDRISQLSETLEDEKAESKLDLEKLSFFRTALSYIEDRIKLTMPDLVQQTEMDALSNEINSAVSQINSYIGNSNVGHLTNATNNFNSALNRIRNFPIPLSKSSFNFSRKIANFEKTVKNKYNALEKEKDSLGKEISDFKEELVKKNSKIEELTEQLKTKESQIQNLNSTFQTDFNNIKSQHNQEFKTTKETFRSEFNSIKTNFTNEVEEIKSTIDTDTSSIVKELETKLQEAKRLVNVIGNVGVTGNYQNIANEHKATANVWRVLAIIFMIIFSSLLIYTIWDVSSENYDWIKSVIRIIAAAALSYPATYAARESSKHRKLETLNRKLELELASLTPFIEMLPEDKKREIKVKLVEKYFGNHVENEKINDVDKEELSIGGFEKVIKSLIPIFKNS